MASSTISRWSRSSPFSVWTAGMRKELSELDAIMEEAKKAALPALEVEPFVEEPVDFDTFCKSDFRAVKVKASPA